MGFARLAETWIRKAQGKSDSDKLSAVEKIASSTVGGALATWNQPIEVVRVEVLFPSFIKVYVLLMSSTDAIYVQVGCIGKPPCKVDHHEYIGFRIPGKRYQGLISRCHASYRPRYLADDLHGLVCRLC
jgi:hypothetical protein